MDVEITQADREAAARWAKMQSRHQQAANMRRGSCDTAPLVQAFAHHRQAAVAAERERCAKVASTWYPDEEAAGCPAEWQDASQGIAAAIRSGCQPVGDKQ
jgi:hypothetical protein